MKDYFDALGPLGLVPKNSEKFLIIEGDLGDLKRPNNSENPKIPKNSVKFKATLRLTRRFHGDLGDFLQKFSNTARPKKFKSLEARAEL